MEYRGKFAAKRHSPLFKEGSQRLTHDICPVCEDDNTVRNGGAIIQGKWEQGPNIKCVYCFICKDEYIYLKGKLVDSNGKPRIITKEPAQ